MDENNIALMDKIEAGDLQGVRELLEKGVSPNAADENGYTALIKSIVADKLEITKALLKAGANVNSPPFTHTAVRAATLYGRVEFLQELIRRGADLSCPSAHGRTALMGCALPRKDVDRIRTRACARLILADPRGKASINAMNDYQENALVLCRNTSKLIGVPVDRTLEFLLLAHGAIMP